MVLELVQSTENPPVSPKNFFFLNVQSNPGTPISQQSVTVYSDMLKLKFDLDKINTPPIQATNENVSLKNSLITQTGVDNSMRLEVTQLLIIVYFNIETDGSLFFIYQNTPHTGFSEKYGVYWF